MALAIDTVATSIAALSVTGVTFMDLNAVSEKVEARNTAVFYPKPDGFLTNFRLERRSTGIGTGAEKDVFYTLNYVFLYAPVDAGRGIYDLLQPAAQKLADVLDALLANDALTGTINIEPQAVEFGVLDDPAGQPFFGATIGLDVWEFL